MIRKITEETTFDEAREILIDLRRSEHVSGSGVYTGCLPRHVDPPTEQEVWEQVSMMNETALDDLRDQFNGWLVKHPGDYWLAGQINRWDGSQRGAYRIHRFDDLVGRNMDTEIFEENGVFIVLHKHHDGTNRFTLVREKVPEGLEDHLGFCDEMYGELPKEV